MMRQAALIALVALAACSQPVAPNAPKPPVPPATRWVRYTNVDSMTDERSEFADLKNSDGSILSVSCHGSTWTFMIRDPAIYGHGTDDVLMRIDDEKPGSWKMLFSSGVAGAVVDRSKKPDRESIDQIFLGLSAGYLESILKSPAKKRLRVRLQGLNGSKDFDFNLSGSVAAVSELEKACARPT